MWLRGSGWVTRIHPCQPGCDILQPGQPNFVMGHVAAQPELVVKIAATRGRRIVHLDLPLGLDYTAAYLHRERLPLVCSCRRFRSARA